MIIVDDLSFSYTKNPFLEDVNFHIHRGEIFGFLGPSGAGKSTLLKILTGVITDYKGSTVVNSIEVRHRSNELKCMNIS